MARREGRPTEELQQLYVLEGFPARVAVSPYRDRFVLKGGVLLAPFGTRRPTRDVDFQAVHLANDTATVWAVVVAVDGIVLDDGLVFHIDAARAEPIRDEDEYSGVRVTMTAALARANLTFHVDVNVGDPVVPPPVLVAVPRLLGGNPVELPGYPLAMVHAAKIITALQRGTANTRWGDYADVWPLSGTHPVTSDDLQTALRAVADHRGVTLARLQDVLDGYPALAQSRWCGLAPQTAHAPIAGPVPRRPPRRHHVRRPRLTAQATTHTRDPRTRQWQPVLSPSVA